MSCNTVLLERKQISSYIIGSCISGILEIILFHPIDTISKRLMSNTTLSFKKKKPYNHCNKALYKVVFGKAKDSSFIYRWLSLFSGVSFAASYKILQRTYKYTMQPIIKSILEKNFGKKFTSTFGKRCGNDMLHATSGSLVGLGEILLLPFDVLKIKAQTNPKVLKGRGLYEILKSEGIHLYRGWNWTAARNIPGSFALFGANSLVYSRIFGTNESYNSTGFQILCASMFGGFCSILCSSPMDVIKTRIQNKAFNDPRTGTSLIEDLIKREGPKAFFKGLTPKLCLIGPKLVFSFTIAQWSIAKIQKKLL